MVGFCNLVGFGIVPGLKITAVKKMKLVIKKWVENIPVVACNGARLVIRYKMYLFVTCKNCMN